jgi:hypothetical protein
VLCIADRQLRVVAEYLQYRMRRLGGDVQGDEDRGLQPARQTTEYLAERGQATERRANHDDVAWFGLVQLAGRRRRLLSQLNLRLDASHVGP